MTNYRRIRYEAPEFQTYRVQSERGFLGSGEQFPGGEAEPFSLEINSQEESY